MLETNAILAREMLIRSDIQSTTSWVLVICTCQDSLHMLKRLHTNWATMLSQELYPIKLLQNLNLHNQYIVIGEKVWITIGSFSLDWLNHQRYRKTGKQHWAHERYSHIAIWQTQFWHNANVLTQHFLSQSIRFTIRSKTTQSYCGIV